MVPLLEVRDVTKDFGGLRALNGINLSIYPGELRCIIGPNGCGKTTLFNVITGTLPPTSGRVRCRGEDITGWPPHRISRCGIARKFQVPGVYSSLSVVENLEIPLLSAAARGGVRALRVGKSADTQLGELLTRFGLADRALRSAGALAHGQKQWLEIAMLLGSKARILLLDEPTAGMSAAETTATAELLRQIQRDSDIAVLVIEHDVNFVRELGCPVIVMIRGAIYFEGSFETARADPRVREAYLGYGMPC
jgi:urea ABC transporter ATP-binding protein UrtD